MKNMTDITRRRRQIVRAAIRGLRDAGATGNRDMHGMISHYLISATCEGEALAAHDDPLGVIVDQCVGVDACELVVTDALSGEAGMVEFVWVNELCESLNDYSQHLEKPLRRCIKLCESFG